jgi:uncharacterized protein (TIGR03435 family)
MSLLSDFLLRGFLKTGAPLSAAGDGGGACHPTSSTAYHNPQPGQANVPKNCVMKRTTAFSIAIALGLALNAQSLEPRFEVASIKEAPTITAAMVAAGKLHVGVKTDNAQMDIGYTSLAELIRMAYDVHPYQVSGPDWMVDRKWDIVAKMPEGASPDQTPRMLQALLAERFGLKVHREARPQQVYALLAAKTGVKLSSSTEDQNQDNPLHVDTSRDGRSTTVTGAGRGVTKTEMQPDGSMHLESTRMTMPFLADALAYYLDRPVIDMTGMPGRYVVNLEFSAADLRFAAIKAGAGAYSQAVTPDLASEPVGASLITSVQKLGLRLEKQQAPLEIIVVDQLDKMPTVN